MCGKAMMAPRANLEKSLSALAPDSPQAVANKVNIDKQHFTDSSASVKSPLEAFGDTDVVVGQEKPELQSIIISCDELLTKTEANIFRWDVQTPLGDSSIGAVDLGAELR